MRDGAVKDLYLRDYVLVFSSKFKEDSSLKLNLRFLIVTILRTLLIAGYIYCGKILSWSNLNTEEARKL